MADKKIKFTDKDVAELRDRLIASMANEQQPAPTNVAQQQSPELSAAMGRVLRSAPIQGQQQFSVGDVPFEPGIQQAAYEQTMSRDAPPLTEEEFWARQEAQAVAKATEAYGHAPELYEGVMTMPDGNVVDLRNPDQVIQFIDTMDSMQRVAPGVQASQPGQVSVVPPMMAGRPPVPAGSIR